MAASYRKTDPRIWDDEVFDTLPLEEAFAAIWLITSRVTNRAGVAFFSLVHATEKLRVKGIDRVSDTLSEASRKLGWPIELIGRNKVVIILRTHFRYNQPTNKKHLSGQLSDLADMPRCVLIEEQYSKTVRPYLAVRWHGHFDAVFDTLSKGYQSIAYRKAMGYTRARASEAEATSEAEAEAENPLTPTRGGPDSPAGVEDPGATNPRELGTNPRAVATKAAEEAEEATLRRRHELVAAAAKHEGTEIPDGTRIEPGGLYTPNVGFELWNTVSTPRLEQINKELLETGGERREVTPME